MLDCPVRTTTLRVEGPSCCNRGDGTADIVGMVDGTVVGATEGNTDGATEGQEEMVGATDGVTVGNAEGDAVASTHEPVSGRHRLPLPVQSESVVHGRLSLLHLKGQSLSVAHVVKGSASQTLEESLSSVGVVGQAPATARHLLPFLPRQSSSEVQERPSSLVHSRQSSSDVQGVIWSVWHIGSATEIGVVQKRTTRTEIQTTADVDEKAAFISEQVWRP